MMSIEKIDEIVKSINKSFSAKLNKGYIELLGSTSNYDEILKAISKSKYKSYSVSSNIKLEGLNTSSPNIPLNDSSIDNLKVDCLIIGGGIIGLSILRELSKFKLNSILIEMDNDINRRESSRINGSISSGIDSRHFPIKTMYIVKGNMELKKTLTELEVPFEECGEIFLLKGKSEKMIYPFIKTISNRLGINNVSYISKEELKNRLSESLEFFDGGFFLKDNIRTNPFLYALSLAENAIDNGAVISLNTKVLDIKVKDGLIKSVKTNRGTIYPKIVINANGLYSDEIAELSHDKSFSILPIKNTEIVLDKRLSNKVNESITSFPLEYESSRMKAISKIKKILSDKGEITNNKSVRISKLSSGNIVVSLPGVMTPKKDDNMVDENVFNFIKYIRNKKILDISRNDIISYNVYTSFKIDTFDFLVRRGIDTKNIIEVIVDNNLISSSISISKDVKDWVLEYLESTGYETTDNKSFNPHHTSLKRLKDYPLSLVNKMIKTNPKYGRVVCTCQNISEGEIIDALNTTFPSFTIDGLRRRLDAEFSLCNGAYCTHHLMEIIKNKKGINLSMILKSSLDSNLIYNKAKEEELL